MKTAKVFDKCLARSEKIIREQQEDLAAIYKLYSVISYSTSSRLFSFNHVIDPLRTTTLIDSRRFIAQVNEQVATILSEQALNQFEFRTNITVGAADNSIPHITAFANITFPNMSNTMRYGVFEPAYCLRITHQPRYNDRARADDCITLFCNNTPIDVSAALFSFNYAFLGALAEHFEAQCNSAGQKASLAMQRILAALSAHYTPRYRRKVQIFDFSDIGVYSFSE